MTEPNDALIGTFIGEYEVIGQLGVGGMGVVYRAKQFNLAREVALKLLPSEYGRDSEYVERFLREARAAARLNHPNIVQVYDAGVYEGHYFFVMEMIRGRNVGDIIRAEKRISERDSIRMILQAALGLGFAHHAGIIHRDVKPENLIMTENGTVKICDLGLAKWGFSQVDKRITQSGMTIGTPHYIAPEQVRGVDVDHRADIYSLGATLYHMLTGRQPFEGQNHAEVMLSHLKKPFPDPRHIYPDLSFESVELLKKMTEKNPDKRFQTMEEVVDAACLIIGAKEIEGMVSPEVAKRLSQRFMEKRRAQASSRATNRAEVEELLRKQRLKTLAGWIFAVAAIVLGWTYWYWNTSERELAIAQEQLRRKGQGPKRVVRKIDIEIPTEMPKPDTNAATIMRDVPEPRTIQSERAPGPDASRTASGEAKPPAVTRPAGPRQVTLEIPGYLLWETSIHPSLTGDEKKDSKRRILKEKVPGESDPETAPSEVQVSGDWRGLMKFDLKQMIKSGSETTGISKAWLVLTPANARVKAGTFDVGLYRLHRPWGRVARRVFDPSGADESTLPRPEIIGVNWEYAETGVRWGFAGADKDTEGLASKADRARNPTAVMSFGSNPSKEPIKIDVTDDIRAWLYGEPNHGWIFIGKGFGSVEFFPGGDNTGRGPKLILVFE